MDKKLYDEMEAKIPHGKVRTRFAPSPTGYMHVGGLRTALYTFLIAKKSGGTFILRIEDTDKARFVEGATEIIFKTLKDTGLHFDEGPGIGGPVAPYTQSERLELYKPYAELLCEENAAYYCFCEKMSQGDESSDALDSFGTESDPCRQLPYEKSKHRADTGEPFVIRMKAPREGETTVKDEVFGEVTTQNKELDDMVLIKQDGFPTYNFANVIDDHLMGITHVMRGSEYISSAPKYNLLYNAFGWEIPKYITVSPVMRDAQNKLSKRHGDPTFDDLLKLGYLSDAVLNYVALLGWSPGGEREMFKLEDMIEVFDVSGISKSPAIFDINKLNHFNSEYIRAMPLEEFSEIAKPYICNVIKNEKLPIDAIAGILHARCEKLSDIPEKIDFFENLPDYDTQLFIHKKSKTDQAISKEMLIVARNAFESLSDWTSESIHDILISLAHKSEIKNATLMWPIRIAVAGKAVTPGGAIEICYILGREETLRRINIGIEKL
ncbi:MAG: glutamate--tRNA ligase [Oscillospiraceae bacterium]|jgi:glutamyl-tRNA synthetase|nr:glutamate--tRNA ligase [Oscillospiraceae bacterium]